MTRPGSAELGAVLAEQRVTVEAGHVARFASAVHDDNRLWADASFAMSHGYRGLPAPPTFGEAFNPLNGMLTDATPPGGPGDLSGRYPVDPGLEFDFSAGNRYLIVHPLVVGDVIDVIVSVSSIRETARKGSGSRLILVDYERRMVRADGVTVGSVIWTHGHFDGEAPGGAGTFTAPGDFELLAESCMSTDRVGLAKWARAVNDYHPIHFDLPYVKAMGFKDVFSDGGRGAALAARTLCGWLGPRGRVHEVSLRYLGFVYPGDEVRARVWQNPSHEVSAEHRRVEIVLTNAGEELLALGYAKVSGDGTTTGDGEAAA